MYVPSIHRHVKSISMKLSQTHIQNFQCIKSKSFLFILKQSAVHTIIPVRKWNIDETSSMLKVQGAMRTIINQRTVTQEIIKKQLVLETNIQIIAKLPQTTPAKIKLIHNQLFSFFC